MISFVSRALGCALMVFASFGYSENQPQVPSTSLPPVLGPNEITRVKIEVASPPDSAPLSDDDRMLLELIAERLRDVMYEHGQANFQPPVSAVPEGVEYVPLAPLFHLDVAAEVHASAFDENGNQRKLDLDQIAERGMFQVPAAGRPGQYSVWKVASLIVKGRKNISLAFHQANSDAYRELRIYFPEALFARQHSLRTGLRGIFANIGGALASVLGGVVREPRHSEEKAREIIEAEVMATLEEGLANQKDFVPDLRIYDRALSEKTTPILTAIESTWATQFQSMRPALEADLRRQSEEGEARASREARVQRALKEKFQEGLFSHIETNRELNDVSPGYGRYVVDRMRALQIVIDHENRLAEAVAHNEELIAEDLRQRYSWRAEDAEWLARQVEKKSTAMFPMQQLQFYLGAAKEMKRMGFAQDAYLLEHTVRTLSKNGTRLKKLLSETTVWSKEYEVANWSGEIERVQDQSGLWHEVPKIKKVWAGYPGWRIWNAIRRTTIWGSHGLHALIVDSFLNGPVGLRVWTEKNPVFYAKKRVDAETGELVEDPKSKRVTIRGQMMGITQSIERDRERLKTQIPGLFGKKVEYAWHVLRNEFGKGVLGRAAVGVGYLGLPAAAGYGAYYVGTHAVALAASSLAVSVTPVAVVLSLPVTLPWAASALIYDFDAPARRGKALRFPLFRYLLGHQMRMSIWDTGSGVVRGAWHLVTPLFKSVWSGISAADRFVGDFVGINVLRFLASGVPARENAFLVKRISGPGISGGYFNEVAPSVAVAAVLASMRSAQLKAYGEAMRAKLAAPYEDFRAFASQLSAYLPLDIEPKGALKSQQESKKRLEEQLAKVLEVETKAIQPARGFHSDAPVKFAASDLAALLSVTEELAKVEYREKVFPWLPGGEVEFWNSQRLTAGDWSSLARMLLSDALGREALEPIEATDQTFRVRVESPDVLKFVDAVLDSRNIAWDDRVVPEPVDGVDEHVSVGLPYPGLGVARFCENELRNLSYRILSAQR